MNDLSKAVITYLKDKPPGLVLLNPVLAEYGHWGMFNIRSTLAALEGAEIIRLHQDYYFLGASSAGIEYDLNNHKVFAELTAVKGYSAYNEINSPNTPTTTINYSQTGFSVGGRNISVNQSVLRNSTQSTPIAQTAENITKKSWLAKTFSAVSAIVSKVIKWFFIAFIFTYLELLFRGII